MIEKVSEHWIGEQFAVVIANSDYTGLAEGEDELFNKWDEAKVPGSHLIVSPETREFDTCEITGLAGPLVKVVAYRDNSQDYGSPEHQMFGDRYLFDDCPGAW